MASYNKIVLHGIPSRQDPEEFVSRPGDLFINTETGQIYLHDGDTPGGTPIGGEGGGGGTLEGFEASIVTDAPNDEIEVSLLAAAGSPDHIDVVLLPKGAGSLLLSLPNGESDGGNKRGQCAVDLQLFSSGKNSPTQVASGDRSFACNSSNTASGDKSHVIGWMNTASGEASHAQGISNIAQGYGSHAEGQGTAATGNLAHAEGSDTSASGQDAHAEGSGTTAGGDHSHAEGLNTNATGEASHAGGGQSNAEGDFSFAHGLTLTADGYCSFATGKESITREISFYQAYSTGSFDDDGDNQCGRLAVKARTTDDTPTPMTCNEDQPQSNNVLSLVPNGAAVVRGTVVAKATSGDASMFEFSVLYKKIGGTTSIVGTPTINQVYKDVGADDWTITLDTDNDLSALLVIATGVDGTDIRWLAELRSQEVNT